MRGGEGGSGGGTQASCPFLSLTLFYARACPRRDVALLLSSPLPFVIVKQWATRSIQRAGGSINYPLNSARERVRMRKGRKEGRRRKQRKQRWPLFLFPLLSSRPLSMRGKVARSVIESRVAAQRGCHSYLCRRRRRERNRLAPSPGENKDR